MPTGSEWGIGGDVSHPAYSVCRAHIKGSGLYTVDGLPQPEDCHTVGVCPGCPFKIQEDK